MRPVGACGSAWAVAASSGGYCWRSWRRCSTSSPSSTCSATTFPSPSASPPPWPPSTWAPAPWRAGGPMPGATPRQSLDAAAARCGDAVVGALAVLVLPLLLSAGQCGAGPKLQLRGRPGVLRPLARRHRPLCGPAGVLAGLAAPRRGRLLAFALPVALHPLDAAFASTAIRRCSPSILSAAISRGPIYDEALRPPLALMLVSAGEPGLDRRRHRRWRSPPADAGLDLRRWRRGALAAATPLLAIGAVLYADGGKLGFHVTRDRSPTRCSTPSSSPITSCSTTRRRQVAGPRWRWQVEDLEFRYQQLQQILRRRAQAPVTVWEFPSAEMKKALVGAGNTLYAKPWTREIFVQGDRFPSPHLRHEMAHVFAGAFGDPLFGIAWPRFSFAGRCRSRRLAMGLVEGVAEAADASNPDGRRHHPRRGGGHDRRRAGAPVGRRWSAPGFHTQAGARAYTIAGSFTTYLLATYGRRTAATALPLGRELQRRLPGAARRSRARLARVSRPPAAHHRASVPMPARSSAARHLQARLRAGAGRPSGRGRGGSSEAIPLGPSPCSNPPAATIPTSRPIKSPSPSGGLCGPRPGGAGPAGAARGGRRGHGAAAGSGGLAGERDCLPRGRLRQRARRRAPRSRLGGDRSGSPPGAGQGARSRRRRRTADAGARALRRRAGRVRRRSGADVLLAAGVRAPLSHRSRSALTWWRASSSGGIPPAPCRTWRAPAATTGRRFPRAGAPCPPSSCANAAA